MSGKKFNIIVAIDNDSTIGIKEYGEFTLPWPLIKEDMNFFMKTTSTTPLESQCNACIVGYNTWTTLPNIYRKNTKRFNIIISKTADTDKSINREKYVKNFDDALEFANTLENLHEIFIIGGAAIYDIAFGHRMLDKIYITHIDHSYPKGNNIEQIISFPLNINHFENFVNDSLLKLEYCSGNKHDSGKNINYCFCTYKVINGEFCSKYNEVTKHDRIIKFKKPTYNLHLDILQSFDEGQEFKSNMFENLEEYQYLDMVNKIMRKGIFKETRNAITKSIFGYQLRYDLVKGYPLSTVKKSYPKAIFEELIWMVRGQTNVKFLQEKGVNIWNKNSSKEYLEKYKLPYKEGDIGPGYGFQMRYFGAKYIDCNTNYIGQGVDQLLQCINLINNDPHSRRILIDLWNCMDMDKCALPVCHCVYNFGVDLYDEPNDSGKKGKLNCHLFQRSWDVLLGWNTTTAALLTYLLAHHCDLDPGVLVHSITDAHLYKSHIDSGAVEKLLDRVPRKAPKLSIIKKHERIEDYVFEDLVIEGYYPCPAIIAEMVA